MATDATEATVNIPQLAVLLVIGFLAVRWMLTSRTEAAPGSTSSRANNAANQQATLQHVETISAMFPHLDRRTIMWDLQRNGNNVQLTTEKILTGRTLETPPQSFQPQILQDNPPATAPAAQARPAAAKQPAQPDLIQRYNLNNKVQEASDSSDSQDTSKTGWSSSKTDRQSALQKRREEMILAARRKMMENQK